MQALLFAPPSLESTISQYDNLTPRALFISHLIISLCMRRMPTNIAHWLWNWRRYSRENKCLFPFLYWHYSSLKAAIISFSLLRTNSKKGVRPRGYETFNMLNSTEGSRAQWLSERVIDWRPRGLTGVTVLCPWARRINPSLVLVQPRKTRPYVTEILLMGCKESN